MTGGGPDGKKGGQTGSQSGGGKPPDGGSSGGDTLREDKPLEGEGGPVRVSGRIQEPDSSRPPLTRLLEREVIVLANGISYRGILSGLGEHSLIIRMASGPKEIPFNRINRVHTPDDVPHLDADAAPSKGFFGNPEGPPGSGEGDGE